MISKQEWFENYGITHGLTEAVKDIFVDSQTVQWEKWREVRTMCITMALDELNLRQRKIILYSYYEKKPTHQIAKKMKLSPQSISNIKKQAVNNLKQNILLKFFLKNPG